MVVLNKTDLIRSGSVSSETSSSQHSSQTDDEKARLSRKNSATDGSSTSVTKEPDALSPSFLCQEMVESLVTCDWGHGFVPASAKNNFNVVQVTILIS